MGVDLIGKPRDLSLNWATWRWLFNSAVDYGWWPKRVRRYYFSNDGQWVDEEDTSEMADALERALNDGKILSKEPTTFEEKVEEVRLFYYPYDSLRELSEEEAREIVRGVEDFSEELKGKTRRARQIELIETMIEICRAGGFAII